jgi:hypothetical protein
MTRMCNRFLPLPRAHFAILMRGFWISFGVDDPCQLGANSVVYLPYGRAGKVAPGFLMRSRLPLPSICFLLISTTFFFEAAHNRGGRIPNWTILLGLSEVL